jgi:hypothetical protein
MDDIDKHRAAARAAGITPPSESPRLRRRVLLVVGRALAIVRDVLYDEVAARVFFMSQAAIKRARPAHVPIKCPDCGAEVQYRDDHAGHCDLVRSLLNDVYFTPAFSARLWRTNGVERTTPITREMAAALTRECPTECDPYPSCTPREALAAALRNLIGQGDIS